MSPPLRLVDQSSVSAEGVSPSKLVTCQSSQILTCCASARQPNTSITSLARPRSTTPISATMNTRKTSTTRGVADHLLAVRPDHLAQLGDDLLQVGPDEDERVARRAVGASSWPSWLLCPSRSWSAASVPSPSRQRRSTSSPVAGRRDRLPLGRCGRVGDGGRPLLVVGVVGRRCGAGTDRARRSPHAFRLVCRGHLPVSTLCRVFS